MNCDIAYRGDCLIGGRPGTLRDVTCGFWRVDCDPDDPTCKPTGHRCIRCSESDMNGEDMVIAPM